MGTEASARAIAGPTARSAAAGPVPADGSGMNKAVGSTGDALSMGLNAAFIVGDLANAPTNKSLPSGSEVASFSLTVRVAGERTTSVPIAWYDPPKRLARWKPGDTAVVSGQVVRRFFRGAGGLGSATEVVVHKAELARHGAKVARLTDDLVASLPAAIADACATSTAMT